MPSVEAPGIFSPVMPLAMGARRLHRTLIDALLTTGRIPSLPELTDRLETAEARLRADLTTLAAADYLALDATGQISCLYPFSAQPTPHVVVIAGQRRFAMCAIDALGIPAMLDREVAIDGQCAVCVVEIALRVEPGTILAATPPMTRVVARRDEAEPAFTACCPFTVFVCGQEHADQFMNQIVGARALSLREALDHGETIFGGLLAETIPATRPRGASWREPRDA